MKRSKPHIDNGDNLGQPDERPELPMGNPMNKITHCEKCNVELRKRKTAPKTANRAYMHLFDYYQCPVCKVNVANPKETLKAFED